MNSLFFRLVLAGLPFAALALADCVPDFPRRPDADAGSGGDAGADDEGDTGAVGAGAVGGGAAANGGRGGQGGTGGGQGATGGTGASGGTGATGATSASGGTGGTGGVGADGSGASPSGGAAATGGTVVITGGAAGMASPVGGVGGTGPIAGAPNVGGMGGTTFMNTCTVPLRPDTRGWMDISTWENASVGVQGAWYAFGDTEDCINRGGHLASECAVVSTPDPAENTFPDTFPNTNGFMHTAGIVDQVLPCVPGSIAFTTPTSGCPDRDYANMWGAFIAFDFNWIGPENDSKQAWDPSAYDVIGVRFTIDVVPPSGMRVEFPMVLTAEEAAMNNVTTNPPTTSDLTDGAHPYWGADGSSWPPSPVMAGVNTILFERDVQAPVGSYVYDPARMLSMHFHVLPGWVASMAYAFTISNVELLKSDPGGDGGPCDSP